MTNNLKILTPKYYSNLSKNVSDNRTYYKKGDFSGHKYHESGVLNFPREIDVSELTKLKTVKNNGSVDAIASDKKNCKVIYETLTYPKTGNGITPREAIEPGVWMRLCHYECLDYLKDRWSTKPYQNIDNYYKNHFCNPNESELRYKNGIGNLWWIGSRLDHDEVKKDFTFDQALDIFFQSTDMPNRVFGSTTIMSYPNLIAAVIRLMDRKENFTKDKSPLKDKTGKNFLKYRRFTIDLGTQITSMNVHGYDRTQLDAHFDQMWSVA